LDACGASPSTISWSLLSLLLHEDCAHCVSGVCRVAGLGALTALRNLQYISLSLLDPNGAHMRGVAHTLRGMTALWGIELELPGETCRGHICCASGTAPIDGSCRQADHGALHQPCVCFPVTETAAARHGFQGNRAKSFCVKGVTGVR